LALWVLVWGDVLVDVVCCVGVPLEVGGCVGCVGWVYVVGVVGVVTGAVSEHETEATGPGREPRALAEHGVPLGAVIVIVWPETSVAVMTVSAATGWIDWPRPTERAPAVARLMISFRVVIRAAVLLPQIRAARSLAAR